MDIKFYLPARYNPETKQFEPEMYTNVAQNVLLDTESEETVADAIEQLHTGVKDTHYLAAVMNELARNDLQQNRALKTLKTESGTVTLTNSLTYPFNNSEKSVTIAARDTIDYAVDVDTGASKSGIGHVIVYDKLKNGFKIAFTGGAASATVKYIVRGGLL